MNKYVADQCRFDKRKLLKVNPPITNELMQWWENLSQQQKVWYCTLHPNSDLTLAHTGKGVFPGKDASTMRVYHEKQANDLKSNLMAVTSEKDKEQLSRLYKQQIALAKRYK